MQFSLPLSPWNAVFSSFVSLERSFLFLCLAGTQFSLPLSCWNAVFSSFVSLERSFLFLCLAGALFYNISPQESLFFNLLSL
jgi:hypothetical protein